MLFNHLVLVSQFSTVSASLKISTNTGIYDELIHMFNTLLLLKGAAQHETRRNAHFILICMINAMYLNNSTLSKHKQKVQSLYFLCAVVIFIIYFKVFFTYVLLESFIYSLSGEKICPRRLSDKYTFLPA